MSTAILPADAANQTKQPSREEADDALIDRLLKYIAKETPDTQMRYTIRDGAGNPCGYFSVIVPEDSPEYAAEMRRRRDRTLMGEDDSVEADQFLAELTDEFGFPE